VSKIINFFKENNNINLVINIYYQIFFLITFLVLLSLIFSQKIYDLDTSGVFSGNVLKIKKESNLYSVKLLEDNYSNNNFSIKKIRETNLVPNIIIPKLPNDLKEIRSTKNRKELFIKITLPIIIKENERLIFLNKKISRLKNQFNSTSRSEAIWLKNTMNAYKVNTIDRLLIKVDAVPVSIALAQAAIESGWGTSRFAFEGNALFGQYIWSKSAKGIIPNDRNSNATYKIKSFDSLRDSVASYMKNLNTNSHYEEFRLHRFIMKNNNVKPIGNMLATYLYNYSIEDDYPSKIQDVIRVNKFEDFETVKIIKKPIITFETI